MTTHEQAPAPSGDAVIRVVVAGPEGRMGRVMTEGLPNQAGLKVIGGLRRGEAGRDLLADADVLVEFTRAEAAPELMLRAIEAGVRPVSGTSGVTEETLAAVDRAARERGIGAVWAPHFRLAGVLMMHFARIAARYLDSAEIVEGHHASKADAPSGTARELARQMAEAHGGDLADNPSALVTLDGARGGVAGGVRVHSLRLPDIVGWHEVILSGDQELLSIRHDDFGREAYVGPVAQAIRKVMQPDALGLIRGYDAVIGLADDARPVDGARPATT